MIDKAKEIRKGEELDIIKLRTYLGDHLKGFSGEIELSQFPSGFSNLTYLLKSGDQEFVLRRPPFGANIKGGHDMSREFKVLKSLESFYGKAPQPILFCDDHEVMGADFYLMERVEGVILRGKLPAGFLIDESTFQAISEATIDHLAALHLVNLKEAGLSDFGKPDGYTERQVLGWVKRYFKAKTDEVESMELVADWLSKHIPDQHAVALIHNDYKYDNLVLHPEKLSEIKAVLDWEMATIGNPLMDLGTSLAYWAEANDSDALKPFSITWMPGNYTRKEFADRYAAQTGYDLKELVFYYVFGAFKIGVIIQQIYARYKKGLTNDPRFTHLIYAVKACGANAVRALEKDKI